MERRMDIGRSPFTCTRKRWPYIQRRNIVYQRASILGSGVYGLFGLAKEHNGIDVCWHDGFEDLPIESTRGQETIFIREIRQE